VPAHAGRSDKSVITPEKCRTLARCHGNFTPAEPVDNQNLKLARYAPNVYGIAARYRCNWGEAEMRWVKIWQQA
jgi:hypothetical protein